MIKVMFLLRRLDRAGAEVQLTSLVTGMDRSKFEPIVVTFYDGGPLEPLLHEAGVKLVCLHKGGRWDLLSFCRRLIKLVKEEKPQILHSYLEGANVISGAVAAFVKPCKVAWGVRASLMDLDRYDYSWKLVKTLQSYLSKKTAVIVSNSHRGADDVIAQGFPAEKMVVIHNGIDCDAYQPDLEAGQALRAEWGLAADQIAIGMVARVDPQKDHPTFVKAAAKIAAQHDQVRFVFVGGGNDDLVAEIQQQAEALNIADKIIWAGRRSDIKAVNNALDIATLTSCYGEGFPNVMGEAMACGTPVVATDIGDTAVVLGDICQTVSHGDPELLAAAWGHLVRLPAAEREAIGAASRTRIVENFSRPRMIDTTQALYERLLETPS